MEILSLVTLTSLTSGTMTTATTDAQLTFTSSNNTLPNTTFSGALNGNSTSSSTSANLSCWICESSCI